MRGGARGWLLAAVAVLWAGAGAGAWADEPVPTDGVLRHAVVCPAFKGAAPLAGIYHAEMVKLLEAADGVEYLTGARASKRRAPEFVFRVNGEVLEDEEGLLFVTVTLTDVARKEAIASLVAPATGDRQALAAWRKTLQGSIEERVEKLPFECRIRRQRGQDSYTLDRGLASGLQPGMVLEVARDDEVLVSHATGEVIGRESQRPVGKIEIFRVMERSAYARPVAGTSLPRSARLYARTF